MDNPDTIAHDSTGQSADRRASRRGILALLGIGGTAAIVGAARPVQAQTTDTTVPSTEPVTTDAITIDSTVMPGATAEEPTLLTATAEGAATPPPKTIQPEDLPLLAAAKVLELTAAEVFETVNGRAADLGLDEAGAAFLASLAVNHRAYAEALSAAHGPGAPKNANPALVAKFGGEVFATGAAADVLAACAEMEHHVADTHLALTGLVVSTDAAALIASILTIEARQAIVLELLQGKTYGADAAAVEDAAGALGLAEITGGN